MTPRRRAMLAAALVLVPALAAASPWSPVSPFASVLAPKGATDAPPAVTLAPPLSTGPGRVALAGLATDDANVADVEVRVDRGAWSSVASAARGAPAGAWAHELDALAPGVRLVEARATDGDLVSLPVGALVKVGATRRPPVVLVADPADGAGVAAGEPLLVAGTASAERPIARVRLALDGRPLGEADLDPAPDGAAAWRFTVPGADVTPGLHAIEVVAEDDLGGDDGLSLPARVAFAAAAGGPAPEVRIAAPHDGAGVSAAVGSAECVAVRPCVRVTGLLDDPAGLADAIEASVDGAAWRAVRDLPGGVVKRTVTGTAFAFEWGLAGQYGGRHVLAVRAGGDAPSAPAAIALNVAGAPALALTLAPAGPVLTHERAAVTAAWPNGTSVLNASWTVDGVPRTANGVGVLEASFPRAGVHEAEALAFDHVGRSARATVALAALNRPPVAVLHAPAAAGTHEPVPLDADASTDPDGEIVAYRVQFGDGAETGWTDPPVATHRYARPGAYVVNLTVRDDLGVESARASRTVVVADSRPVALFSADRVDGLTVRDHVTFADASFDADGPIVHRVWDFGDGSGVSCDATACAVTGNPADTVAPAITSVSHRFASRGAHAVTLAVRDAAGQVASARAEIVVDNLAPAAAFSWTPASPRAGEVVRFRDESRDADGAVLERAWTFGEEGASAAATPAWSFPRPGNYTVVLRVVDDAGVGASVARVVGVGNRAPLVNATWAPLRPRSLDPVHFTSLAVDPDGSLASLRWDFGDGANSTERDPTHHFTQPGAFNVSLTVEDELGARASRTFQVLVENMPPTARIASPRQFAYAGVPTALVGEGRDVDGRVVAGRWEIRHATGRTVLAGVAANHTFPEPGVYRLRFTAVDDLGGESNETLDLQVDVAPADTHPPVVRVEFPQPNATFLGEVRFTGTARSIAPIARVEISIWADGRIATPFATPWVRAEGRDAWSFPFDSRTVPNGEYDLVVRAVDARGARGEARVPFAVENVQQGEAARILLDVTSLAPGQIVAGTHVLRGNAHHRDGLTALRVRVDEGTWSDALESGTGFAFPIDTTAMSNGDHAVAVRAYLGPLVMREVVVPFRVENHAPLLVVTRPMPENATGVVTVAGAFGPGGPPGNVTWRVDRLPWRPAESSAWLVRIDTREIANGPHTVQIRATSADGLTSPVVSFDFRVANVAKDDTVGPRSRHQSDRDVPLSPAVAVLALAVALAAARRRAP